MIAVVAPREMVARKARHGQPCTGCGLCCHVQLCDMASAAFKRADDDRLGPCPALQWKDGKSECGLLVNPTKYPRGYAVGHEVAVKAAALLIDPGVGCDMAMEGERDMEYTAMRNRMDRLRWPAIKWAAAVWGYRIRKKF